MQHLSHTPILDDTLFLSGVQPDYDHSQEVAHLQVMVEKELKNLNTAFGRMQQVERELHRFLADYYGEVGGFFEQLEQLNHQIGEYERQIKQASRKRARVMRAAPRAQQDEDAHQGMLPPVPFDMRKDEVETEIKAVYRKLAKLYHPDVAEGKPYSQQVIQLLNRAYSKKNLWAMREMEHSLVEHAGKDDAPEAKLNRLKERFDALATSVTKVGERRRRLEQSEAWRLKQRVEQDRLLVEVVIHRVKKQIADANQQLIRKKIEYKAVMAH